MKMSSAWKSRAALGRRLCAVQNPSLGQGVGFVSRATFPQTFANPKSAFSTAVSTQEVLPWNERPKMVILGVGWGAVNVIRNLEAETLKKYNILVCSPTNHFVNTPLLPSVTVGTLGPRAVAEPIRQLIRKHRQQVPGSWIKFNEVECQKVDTKRKKLLVSTRGHEGRAEMRTLVKGMESATVESSYELDYDVLVCAVGATSNTFGTPGATEYCTFLKTVQDAMKIRTTLLDCFETAAARGRGNAPDEEIDRLLSFVIVGAGPTGVEIAAELRDFVKEDVVPSYSGFKDRKITITVVEMAGSMLGTYDKVIQDICRKRFAKADITMLTKHQVKKVNPTSVEVLDLETNTIKDLPFGMCVWASGVRPNTVSLDLAKDLQETRMLEVDGNLRVRGAEGSIFALGDCAKITLPTMKSSAQSLFEKADENNDGVLSLKELETFIEQARKEYPHLEAYLGETSKASIEAMYLRMTDLKTEEEGVRLEDFKAALELVDRELKMLPPTAQVAMQQGEYLAKILNTVSYEDLGNESQISQTFEYQHQGSMAYIGGERAVIHSPIFGIQSGLLTYMLWKGIYFGRSVSMKMRVSLLFDWAKSWFLGRCTSRL